ncbi:copper resistance protein CopC [Streptomyces sp. NPDC058463]|uniref:copper resistance CopC/CopD family protein n=1 Tax=Streptomyces sp. NPDC058463 TaxID=3346510 RepID=UPI00366752ED
MLTASRTYGWALALLICAGLLAGGAAPADAHAVLTSSTPARGAVIAEPPARVVLVFTEEIALTADAIRVLGPAGRRVDNARPAADGGSAYAVGLRGSLPRGTYTVAYQVVSADSHPITGAFTFSVGAPSATAAAGDVRARDPDAGTVGRAYAAARIGAYISMVVLTGGVCFLLLCWPRGREHRLLRHTVTTAWSWLAVCTLALLALRGAYTGSGQVRAVTDLSRLGEVLTTKAGLLLAARLVLLAVCAAGWAWWSAQARRGGSRIVLVGAALGAALAWTWAGAEHASAGLQPAVAVPVDVVHLLAAGAWVGGLCVLTAALIGIKEIPAEAMARFSRMAFASVCALVVTGLYQSWRQVGSLAALTDTRFGLLLLAKCAGVALLLCLGYTSRRRTRALTGAGDDTASGSAAPSMGTLQRWVAAEAVLGVCVLALTTVLTSTEPARAERSAAEATDVLLSIEAAFNSGGPNGRGRADVVVEPGRTGANAVHVSVTDPDGQLLDVPEIRATLTSSAGIGPLSLPLRRASAGHWTVSGFQLPSPGTWELALTVRTSEVDQVTLRRPLGVR